MKRYIFDIEADGLLDTITKIHCIVVEDFDTGYMWTFRSDDKINTIQKGLELISSADIIIAHNGTDYDIRAILKLYPKFTYKKLEDTLVMSRVIWSNIKETDFNLARKGNLSTKNIGRHSLEAWGERLKFHKGDYGKTADWSRITDEMVEYCQQDVKVTSKLYHLIQRKQYPQDVLDMEQEIHRLCSEQTEFGFPFNVNKAQRLQSKLMARKAELSQILTREMGIGWITSLGEKVSKRTVKYKDPLRGNETAGCYYTKVKFIEFNPNSRSHLTRQLQHKFGWKPSEFNEDGTPTLDDDILAKMDLPIAKLIGEFLMIQKRLGQLSEGNQAWLSLEKNGKIHGRVNTMGAVTARCTHSDPNLAQIPSCEAPYGKECRELFEAPKGWKQFGTDAAGLELRMLSHYMARWDNGDYGNILLKGDIHSANQQAAGLPTRSNAKTFIYGFLYGAGDEKLAEIINGTRTDGKRLREKFLNNTPALKKLREAVDAAVEKNGQLKAIDGRMLPVRHKHAALNTLLQSAGAIACKMWGIRMHELLKEKGLKHGPDYRQAAFIHDEYQIHFDPNKITAEELGDISRKAILDVTEKLKLRIPLDIDWKVGENYAETH